MGPLEHYEAVRDELETRIDAIATIFAIVGQTGARNMPPAELTDALTDLGCDRVELNLAIERAGT